MVVEEMRVCMSGVGWGYWGGGGGVGGGGGGGGGEEGGGGGGGVGGGYWREADVRGDFMVLEAEGGSWVEMAWSSGMPGCGACSLVQTRPA